MTGKVWFHRARAALWLIVGVLSFAFGWADSVVLVWVASLHANIVSDIGAAEAADDRDVMDRLERIEHQLAALVERRPGDA